MIESNRIVMDGLDLSDTDLSKLTKDIWTVYEKVAILSNEYPLKKADKQSYFFHAIEISKTNNGEYTILDCANQQIIGNISLELEFDADILTEYTPIKNKYILYLIHKEITKLYEQFVTTTG